MKLFQEVLFIQIHSGSKIIWGFSVITQPSPNLKRGWPQSFLNNWTSFQIGILVGCVCFLSAQIPEIKSHSWKSWLLELSFTALHNFVIAKNLTSLHFLIFSLCSTSLHSLHFYFQLCCPHFLFKSGHFSLALLFIWHYFFIYFPFNSPFFSEDCLKGNSHTVPAFFLPSTRKKIT